MERAVHFARSNDVLLWEWQRDITVYTLQYSRRQRSRHDTAYDDTDLSIEMLLVNLDSASLAFISRRWLEYVPERLGADFAVCRSSIRDGQQLVAFVRHKRLGSRPRLWLNSGEKVYLINKRLKYSQLTSYPYTRSLAMLLFKEITGFAHPPTLRSNASLRSLALELVAWKFEIFRLSSEP